VTCVIDEEEDFLVVSELFIGTIENVEGAAHCIPPDLERLSIFEVFVLFIFT
jgi:hypothetical protein